MIDKLKALQTKNVICPPKWMLSSVHLLCKMGSHAYGMNNEQSDIDLYGLCIPPIRYILPHTEGVIEGFGKQINSFEQYQVDNIEIEEERFDISVYNITKFFQLCMENNPNMIDCLFVPDDCILFKSRIAELLLKNRELFLHKGAYHRFLGYAFAQLKKIKNKNPIGKRKIIIDTYGYDTKYACHLYRLANECEQILKTGTIDLRQCKGQTVFIRGGGMKLEELENWFENKQKELEQLCISSTLRDRPEENKIKALLIECIEMFHGELEKFTFNDRGIND